MNQEISTPLKIIVERVVRPVVALNNQKRQLREELLAHVTAVFEDEHERTGNVQSALEATRNRLGDPTLLSAELQREIPGRHRAAVALEILERDSNKSLLRMAAIHFGLAIAFLLVTFLLFGLPVAFFRGRLHEIGAILRVVGVMSITMGSITFAVCFGADRMGRAVAAKKWRQAFWFVGLATLFLPFWSFATYWALTSDLAASLDHLKFACLFAPFVPVGLILVSRQLADEVRHREEWASLDLDC